MGSTVERMADLAEDVRADDHSYGPPSALVTIVEYADFDCRFCTEAFPVVRELSARFAPYLRLVFRHGPRSHDHSRAGLAANAVEAAAEQGKSWEMHDCLFEHYSALEAVDLLVYAGRLGLDRERFAETMCGHSHRAHIRRDQLSGVRSHVISTPAFFINGKRFSGGTRRETLTAAIEHAQSAAIRRLRPRGCHTTVEALARLLAVTTSLRGAYKRHYWRGLPLPFSESRMLCGHHAREQSELAAELSRRAQLVEKASPARADSEIQVLDPEAIAAETNEIDPWLARLLRAHEFALLTAHSVANRLAELDDAESCHWVKSELVLVNERQVETIAKRILAGRRRAWVGTDH